MNEPESIADKINSYLQADSDYGFELKCLNRVNTMDQCFHEWTHTGTYIDDITSKPREFDIRGSLWPKKSLNHILHVAIECKNLASESPLIVHCSKRATEKAYIQYVDVEFRDENTDYSLKGDGFDFIRDAGDLNPYKKNEFVGKSLARLKWNNNQVKSSDSELYDKWSQALSSSHDLIIQSSRTQPEHLRRQKIGSRHFVLPIVAIPEGTLWTANYDDEGQMTQSASEAEEVSYFVDRKYEISGNEFTCSHVHFVTEPHLPEFLWDMLNKLA